MRKTTRGLALAGLGWLGLAAAAPAPGTADDIRRTTDLLLQGGSSGPADAHAALRRLTSRRSCRRSSAAKHGWLGAGSSPSPGEPVGWIGSEFPAPGSPSCRSPASSRRRSRCSSPAPPVVETPPRPPHAGLEGEGPLLLSPDPLPPAGRLVWRSLPGSTSRGIPAQRRCTRSCATTSRRCTGRSGMGRSRCASPSTPARSWRPTSVAGSCAEALRG